MYHHAGFQGYSAPPCDAIDAINQQLDDLARRPSPGRSRPSAPAPPAAPAPSQPCNGNKDAEIAALRAEVAALKALQSQPATTPTPQHPATPATLKMVAIVHRHGARFPTKQLGGDLCWPASKQFWSDFKAQLTTTGAVQHNRLGALLRKRYAGLFSDLDKSEINNVVKVHTSNYQRTLFSAWSFMFGMFPEVPRYYNYLSDRQDVDMEKLEKTIEAQDTTLGIPINIESNDSDDYMFHQIKADTTPQEAKDFEDGGAASLSPILQAMDKDPKYIALCEKLYKITGKKALLKPLARICKLKVQMHAFICILTDTGTDRSS